MGLRDLFPGYYLPTKDELEKLWQEGIYVFDTNVLLHIYRYSPATREELFSSWEFVSDRIWIPYQVALEFQKNRFTVVAERKARYRLCRELLNQNLKDLQDQLKKEFENKSKGDRNPMSLRSMWHEVLSQVDFESLAKDYQKALEYLEQKEIAHGLPDEHGSADLLRDKLDTIFGENIGLPPSDELAAQQLDIAQTRCNAKTPPGYCDSENKDEIRAASDGIIWLQILDYASHKKQPIIFVTDEEKEDWCWKPDKKSIWGARPELVQEMQQFAGVSFALCSSTQFIKEVSRLCADKEHLQEQERIKRELEVEAALAEAEAIQNEEREGNRQADSMPAEDEILRIPIDNQIRDLRKIQLESYKKSFLNMHGTTDPFRAFQESQRAQTEKFRKSFLNMHGMTDPFRAFQESQRAQTEKFRKSFLNMHGMTDPFRAFQESQRAQTEKFASLPNDPPDVEATNIDVPELEEEDDGEIT